MPAGVEFADLGGVDEAIGVYDSAAARFVDCTFRDNAVTGANDGVGAIILATRFAGVWLQGCQFFGNTVAHELAAWNEATFYNDGPHDYYARRAEAVVHPRKAPPEKSKSKFLELPHDFVTDASGVRCRFPSCFLLVMAALVTPQLWGGLLESLFQGGVMQRTCWCVSGARRGAGGGAAAVSGAGRAGRPRGSCGRTNPDCHRGNPNWR